MREPHSYIASTFIILLSWVVSFSAIASSLSFDKKSHLIENAASNSQDDSEQPNDQELNELFSVKIINNIVSFQLDIDNIKYFEPIPSFFIPRSESPSDSELVLELLPIEHIIFNHYIAPNAP